MKIKIKKKDTDPEGIRLAKDDEDIEEELIDNVKKKNIIPQPKDKVSDANDEKKDHAEPNKKPMIEDHELEKIRAKREKIIQKESESNKNGRDYPQNILKHKVNLFMFVLIVLMIGYFVFSSLVNQKIITHETTKKAEFEDNFSSCANALSSLHLEMEELKSELSTTEVDIKKYDELYEEKASLLDETSTELKKTQKELDHKTAALLNAIQDLDDAEAEVESLEANLTYYKAVVIDLNEKIRQKNALLDAYEEQCGDLN
ncbi:hypothetical protein JW868_01670 [Candidatus Woesearchaeota archaeon]|nr:hypothetical protein [Candidatus Woesearchaeota archaeon]